MNQPLKSEAVKRFLEHFTHPDLAELYHLGMELQVHVGQDGGTRIEGEYKGKSWHAYSDGMTQWKSFRIPLNAKTSPKNNDGPMNWDLVEHAEGIGMTGWDWLALKSRWVGFDFDGITGHADNHSKKLTDAELLQVQMKACEIPWVTVRKSTSGKGLHLYVFIEDVTTANHDEHAAVARSILGLMSMLVGYDFSAKVDACGYIMWTWHRKMKGTDGLSLIKQGVPLHEVPPNWRDHIEVVRGRRRKTLPSFVLTETAATKGDEAEAIFEELCGQSNTVSLDADHHRFINWMQENGCNLTWEPDHHMLITHTFHLAEAHEALGLKGPFKTLAKGTERGVDHNCFMFPLRRGAWAVRRYTPGVQEESTWSKDSAGWTRCFFNREPDLKTVSLAEGGTEHASGGFIFSYASDAQKAVLGLGVDLKLPTWAGGRTAKLKERERDGKLVAQIPHEPTDNPNDMIPHGWYHEKKVWHRVMEAQVVSSNTQEVGNFDDIVRHPVTSDGEDAGWVIRVNDQWHGEPLTHVRTALESDASSLGLTPKQCKMVLGGSILKPWRLVNLPFKEEYPGDRTWNRNAAQFRYFPSQDIDNLNFPTWTKILKHVGSGLDHAVKHHPWAKNNDILTGADYLKVWIGSLFQQPLEHLPYLFLYSSEQNTGKSIFHEALSLLIVNGVVRADSALTSTGTFNGELENAVLCVVEETDLRKHKGAYNRIKDWVNALTISIHKKNFTPYSIPNATHWIQCSNDSKSCPVGFGDSRITMIEVPPLDPCDLIPKSIMIELLKKEAPDFMAAVLSVDIPPPVDRLNVPVIASSEKKREEEANQTMLELFLREKTYYVTGKMIKVGEFYERFQEFLDPSDLHEWSKIAVGRAMPSKFPKGRKRGDGQHYFGNISWDALKQGEKILPRLVLDADNMYLESEGVKV
jgi:hypothetical protein